MENINLQNNRLDLANLTNSINQIRNQIGNIVIGQPKMIDHIIIAILTNGHILIEGVPGVAKTLTAKLIAKTIDAKYSRIQFTPDLMPSDVLGTSIFNLKTSDFEFNYGPIFANIILIDEINRAPAKTQSALFEVMEERQITIDGTTYKLTPPFIVLATQNPIEHEGTYRLPEAQLDRFIFKIDVTYPTLDDEVMILNNQHQNKATPEIEKIAPILTSQQINNYQQQVQQIYIEQNLIRYIAQITNKTRNNNALYLGASPRASIAIMNASKAMAAINARDYVTPDDIKNIAYPVLRHRIILTPEKEMEGITIEQTIKQIIESVEVPR